MTAQTQDPVVTHDLFQYGLGRRPKFVKSYANLGQSIMEGTKSFINEVPVEWIAAGEPSWMPY